MFVPILTDMFNYWFVQGAIPGSITKGVITLLKKKGQVCLGGSRRLQTNNFTKHRVKDFGPGLSEPTAACR